MTEIDGIEKESGGHDCTCAPTIPIASPEIKDLSKYPVPCRKCAGREYVQEDGPDTGVVFLCGICSENMEAGCTSFTCSHFRTEPNVFTVVTRESDKMICKHPGGKTCLCDPDYNSCGKTIAAIIDADKVQETALIERLLAQGREYQRTGDPKVFLRPVIIAEESLVSPHEFMDEAIARVNQEQRIIRNAVGSTCFLCGKELGINEPTSHGSCMRCWNEAHT